MAACLAPPQACSAFLREQGRCSSAVVLSSAGKCCFGVEVLLGAVRNLLFESGLRVGAVSLQTQAPGFAEASEYPRELLHALLRRGSRYRTQAVRTQVKQPLKQPQPNQSLRRMCVSDIQLR